MTRFERLLTAGLVCVLMGACRGTERPPSAPADDADSLVLATGNGSFSYRDVRGNAERRIQVRYFRPEDYGPETPIVFVMHGASRAGQRYFDDWTPEAQRYGFLLLVPEFDDVQYPGSVWYNLGHVFDTEAPGTPNPTERWTFTAIEHLFEDVRTATGGRQAAFRIYGHSAGSQFVHRFLMLRPDAPVERAVAANAGWYTLPVDSLTWPYGLSGAPTEAPGIAKRFGASLTVLLGDQDVETTSSSLRNTPEARAQGPHRFARGHTFYGVARSEAERLGTSFTWVLDTVPGATHSNALMAPAAAEILGR